VYYKLEELNKELIDIETFQKFSEKHPALLYPAFEMQTRFKRKVIGNDFWATLIRNRVQLFKDRYVPIGEILLKYADRYEIAGDPLMEQAVVDGTDNNDFSDLAVPDEADEHELTPAQRQLEAARRNKMMGGSGQTPSLQRSNTTGQEIIPVSRGNRYG
jgi:hypothetical protein